MRELGGPVPGSMQFHPRQEALQPPTDSTDVVSVIKGVIAAEDAAIAQYKRIIKLCEGEDYVTQDLCIKALAGEEAHHRDFTGFLMEHENR